MKLREFIDLLVTTELSKISVKNEVSNGNYSTLIPVLNLGIIELYSRFLLLEKELVLQQYDWINTYLLDKKHAVSSPIQEVKYIIDTPDAPFTNDLLVIESVYDEDGRELYLNDGTEWYSVHIPAYNKIQIPYPERENILLIVYRARPELLDINNLDLDKELEIPEYLIDTLVYFCSAKIMSGMNKLNNAGMYNNKYIANIKELSSKGLLSLQTSYKRDRFGENGWV